MAATCLPPQACRHAAPLRRDWTVPSRLHSGRLYIPAGRHFCLYALRAAFSFLAAKQRPLPDGDWLNRTNRILCPDPAGNVILRIDRVGG